MGGVARQQVAPAAQPSRKLTECKRRQVSCLLPARYSVTAVAVQAGCIVATPRTVWCGVMPRQILPSVVRTCRGASCVAEMAVTGCNVLEQIGRYQASLQEKK